LDINAALVIASDPNMNHLFFNLFLDFNNYLKSYIIFAFLNLGIIFAKGWGWDKFERDTMAIGIDGDVPFI
jgi:hypothetical protein